MPETDILNPTPAWEADIQDSMCPNYMLEDQRPSTMLRVRTVSGGPWSREMDASPHVFNLSWSQRSTACARRLRQYFEQYERGGFFTLIDHENGGRHYVGNFSSPLTIVEAENGVSNVSNVTFTEIPGKPMLQYPSNWDRDAVWFSSLDDDGDQDVAVSGAWNQAALGAAPQLVLGGFARTYLTTAYMANAGATAGDAATYEYRGYGFKLWMLKGPAQGKADVYIDGALNTTVDCYAAAAAVANVLTAQNLPLDIHDVQVVVDATKNNLSTGTAIGWYGLQVMR